MCGIPFISLIVKDTMFQIDSKNDLWYKRNIDFKFQIQLKSYSIQKWPRCLTEPCNSAKSKSISSPKMHASNSDLEDAWKAFSGFHAWLLHQPS